MPPLSARIFLHLFLGFCCDCTAPSPARARQRIAILPPLSFCGSIFLVFHSLFVSSILATTPCQQLLCLSALWSEHGNANRAVGALQVKNICTEATDGKSSASNNEHPRSSSLPRAAVHNHLQQHCNSCSSWMPSCNCLQEILLPSPYPQGLSLHTVVHRNSNKRRYLYTNIILRRC